MNKEAFEPVMYEGEITVQRDPDHDGGWTLCVDGEPLDGLVMSDLVFDYGTDRIWRFPVRVRLTISPVEDEGQA